MAKVTHLTLTQSGELANRRVHLREIEDVPDTPTDTIGSELRAARLRRGEDLAEVSRVLKIRQEHLEAMEEDRLTALPGRTYAVGFVRAYAQHLGIDPLAAVERFKAESAGRVEVSKTAGFPEVPEESGAPYGWIAVTVIVAGLIVYGGYSLMTSPEQLAKQPVAPVPAHIFSKAGPKTASVATQPKVPLGETKLSPPAAGTTSTAPASNPVPAGNQAPAAAQSAGSAIGPDQSSAQATQPASPPPVTGHVYGVQNQNPRVILRAKEATRILVEDADGRVYLNRALQPGDAYQVPDRPGLLLTAQHGNAVEVDLDGQAMGLVGQTPDIAEAMSLDPQAIADHYSTGDAE